MKRTLARLKPAWRWIARVCTPSDAAWNGAAWGLIGFWVFIVLSFLLHDVVPDFAVGKVAGLAAMLGALVLAGLGALLALRAGRPYGAVVFLWRGLAASATLVVGMARVPKDPNPTLASYRLAGATLNLPDPGKAGPYRVRTLTYGSGTDLHRPEFAAKAAWRSRSVDGSRLDKEWKGPVGWFRTLYWGFDPKRFPVQGRVWLPEAPGRFPLVLIVHGNHSMEDYSDPGYAYLGELLASQGFIMVSVDENFLNSSLSDMVDPIKSRPSKENDARGWMLLEHLAQWRRWNADPAHPLYGKVDMNRIGLMGHSRGGEAVAVAAAFNGLDHYPDDATQAFDYDFNIGAVVAIAPVDGQYKPRERPTPLKDVNYFVIHGSLDGDVTSFMGSSQFSRDRLTGEVPALKAQLYVKDANHGQFNTSWGRDDIGMPWPVLDKRSILDPDAQRQIARVYFSAFLQMTLMGREGYRPLFEDPRRGAAWLPKGYLASDYADSATVWAATFEEDINPGTATSPGAKITGRNLSVWREADPSLKVRPLDSQIAQVAWDDRVHKATASYAIDLGLASNVTGPAVALVFSAADAGIASLPDGFEPPKSKTRAKTPKAAPLDWTVVLVDSNGVEARVPLSRDQVLYPQIKGQTRRFPEIDGGKMTEAVMRRYRLPMADFAAANPRLDLTRLKSVRFDFDRSKRGTIALDNVGIAPGSWIGEEGRPSSLSMP